MHDYFDALGNQTGIDVTVASPSESSAESAIADCCRMCTAIAKTDTQMFVSEREMMLRAANLLESK